MKRIFKKIIFSLNLIGFDLYKFLSFFKGLRFYFSDFIKLKRDLKSDPDFPFGKFFPILNERDSESGAMKSHYFQQDLFVARKIFEIKPIRHIDVGSRIDGFVAHVATFREIEVFDIRPLQNNIKNILFTQADLMQLPPSMIECCDSLSTLHVIEHFGLGRYGDTIDKDGHLKAIKNLYLMLKKGGIFYFSTPIGNQRIEFNAHRVFSMNYLLKIFHGIFYIESFHFVDDSGVLYEDVKLELSLIDNNYGCNYGCGIFILKKI